MKLSDTAVFLDTNVPLYSIGRDSDFRLPCQRLLAAASAGEYTAVTDVEVLQEIAHQTNGRGRREMGLNLIRQFMRVVTCSFPVDAEDLTAMVSILSTYTQLTPRDAIHLAVMQRHGVHTIITADRHFTALPGLTVLDPLAAANLLA